MTRNILRVFSSGRHTLSIHCTTKTGRYFKNWCASNTPTQFVLFIHWGDDWEYFVIKKTPRQPTQTIYRQQIHY